MKLPTLHAARLTLLLLGALASSACNRSSTAPIADLDNDGIPDAQDLDLDGDGVPNDSDAFPRDPLEFYDTDGDGLGNLRQLDEDGDDVADIDDAFPLDATRSVALAFAEQGFNDNLGAANATSPSLVGATAPPAALTIEERLVRIDGTMAPAFDTDVFLVAPPAGVDVSFVLRSIDSTGSVENLRLGIVGMDGASRPSAAIHRLSVERAVAIWGNYDDEVLGLVVNDLGGATNPIAYQIEICVDRDHDGVGDDRERALGARVDAIDSDGDGLTDLDEMLGLSDFDPDGDIAPTWLDRDSDQDGWSDAVETPLDSDRDGLPNHVDLDADDNGIADADEPSGDGVLRDFDGDQVLDAFDLDDDDDGLLDIDDASPRQPAAVLANGAGALFGSEWLFQGSRIREIVRTGSSLRLLGNDFGSAPETRFVAQFTRQPDRRGRRWVNAPVSEVVAGELQADVPDAAATGPVRLLDGDEGRVTRALPLRVVASNHPVIITPFVRQAPGQTAFLSVVNGPANPSGLTIELNGAPLLPQFATTQSIGFTIPADAQPGELRLAGSFGTSNPIPIAVTRTVNGSIVLPAGSPAAGAARTMTVGTFSAPLSLGQASAFSMTVPANVPFLVSVSRTTGQGTPLLLAVANPDAATCNLNVASTAIALVWTEADRRLGVRRDAATAQSLLQALPTATGMAAVTSQLEALLANDAEALADPPPSLLEAIASTADAALSSLPALLAAGSTGSRYTIEPLSAAGFTPMETSGFPRFVLENDTLLFASAALFELDSDGQVVGQRTPHVASYFAADMIVPQNGAPFFSANRSPIPTPKSTRTLLQLITAGRVGSDSVLPIDLAAYDAVTGRTLLSQLIIPVVSQATGRLLGSDQVLLKLLIRTIGPTIENALENYTKGFGTLGSTVLAILDAVLEDLTRPLNGQPSAILSAALEEYGQQLATAAAADLAKRVVGNLLAFLRIYRLTLTTINTGGLASDLNSVPAGLDFRITNDLRIDQLDPARAVNYHWGTQDWDLPLRAIGTGMIPDDGYQAWQQVRGLVNIRVDGRYYPADSILFDGTSTISVLRQADVERLSPGTAFIQVEVDFLRLSNELELEVFDRPVVDRMIPATGRPGDVVVLEGIGFNPQAPAANEVEFTGATDPVYGEVLDVAPNGRRLTLRIPVEVATGPVTLSCERPDGERVQADPVTFTLATSTITFWDSGNLKDDIFALYLDGSLLQLPATPVFPPITTEVALEPDRQYEVLLLGVSAPDQIGTYTISFSPEIEVLPGSDALSGNDLVANATKFFYIRVNSSSSAAPLQLEADPAVPVWFEPTTGAGVTAAGR